MTTTYDRFDPEANYDRIMFRPDRLLQSAEFNEVQSAARHRLKGVANVLLKDGAIIRGAGLILDAETGQATLEAGALYLDGAVRGIAPAKLQIPLTGNVTVGAYLIETLVTELDDPLLYNPAVGTRGYNEPGAARLQITPAWGVQGESVGQFFPVHTVIDGVVLDKAAPPNLDAVAQAIARYDRDSTEGCYVVQGLTVDYLGSDADDEQRWLINSGRARVNGNAVELSTSRRITYDAAPDTRLISSEPHLIAGPARQRINVNRPAIAEIIAVQLTSERTVTINHGAYVGAIDVLPDTSVLEILSVKQGSTTYKPTTDYKLGAAAVDWTPGGAEPAIGSAYQVTYRYIATPAPLEADARGFSVQGGVGGSVALVSYRTKLPRIDRLCLDTLSAHVWIRGVASLDNPIAPIVPANMLAIASINQTWLDDSRVVNADGARMVPMQQLNRMFSMVDDLYLRLAELRLATDASGRESGIRRGVFVDAFANDSMRDAGFAQTAAIVDGELLLPVVNVGLAKASEDVGTSIIRCHYESAVEIDQPARTGSMKINSYGAQLPMPARVTLSPSEDRWTETSEVWASPVTKRLGSSGVYFIRPAGMYNESVSVTETLKTEAIWTLREIDVEFEVEGFGAGQRLIRVTFDGLECTPVPLLTANDSGVVRGKFRIPPGVTTGRKRVIFTGDGGATFAEAEYYGEGTREITEKQQITTLTPVYTISAGDATKAEPPRVYPPGLDPSDFSNAQVWVTKLKIYDIQNGTCHIDPLAQTFTVDRICQPESVSVMLTKRGGSSDVMVQIRATNNGVPTMAVLAESNHKVRATGGYVIDAVFTRPPVLYPGIEYAVVVLTDDMQHELAVATLGEYDAQRNAWVSTQAYQIGVLLSSANASTWTPHQDRDLWFKLNVAKYISPMRDVALGEFTVDRVTDCVFLAGGESPAPGATVEYRITLPDGTVIAVADLQPLQFSTPVTGKIAVAATIRSTERVSGVLRGTTELALGRVENTGTYVSRSFTAGQGVRLRVIYDAVIPNGSSVLAEFQRDNGAWQPCAAPSAIAADNGALELTSLTTGINAGSLRVRLTLAGTAAARPRVRNLRCICTE